MLSPEHGKPLNKLLEKLKVNSDDTAESGISMTMTPNGASKEMIK